jgi:hypothetical protein
MFILEVAATAAAWIVGVLCVVAVLRDRGVWLLHVAAPLGLFSTVTTGIIAGTFCTPLWAFAGILLFVEVFLVVDLWRNRPLREPAAPKNKRSDPPVYAKACGGREKWDTVRPKGTWMPNITNGLRCAHIRCHLCGRKTHIKSHEIQPGGRVRFLCTNERCLFHGWIGLDKWPT